MGWGKEDLMRNPCQICERALLDKDRCSSDCKRRHEYCKYMGIGAKKEIGPIVERGLAATPRERRQALPSHPVPKVVLPPKVLKQPCPPKTAKAPRVPKPPKPPFDWHAPRGMRSKGGRLEAATELLKEGRSVRYIYKATGMSKNTVTKLRKVLEEQNGRPILCGCGEPAVHHGACYYRRERKG